MDATGSWTQHRLEMPERESPRSNHTGSRSGSRSRRLGEQERSASQQRSAPHCHDGHQDVNQEQQPSRRLCSPVFTTNDLLMLLNSVKRVPSRRRLNPWLKAHHRNISILKTYWMILIRLLKINAWMFGLERWTSAPRPMVGTTNDDTFAMQELQGLAKLDMRV